MKPNDPIWETKRRSGLQPDRLLFNDDLSRLIINSLVEMAGIEPASATFALKRLQAYLIYMSFVGGPRINTRRIAD